MGSLLDSVAVWMDSNFWAAMLVDVSVKGALILVAAEALVRFVKPTSASFRHLVRSLSLLALIALPLCRFLAPPWQVEILPRSPWPDSAAVAALLAEVEPPPAPASLAAVPPPMEAGPSAAAETELAALPGPSATTALPANAQTALYAFLFRWQALLLLVWAAGAALVSGRMLVGVACVQYAISRSRALETDGWESLAQQARRRLNLRRRVRLRTIPGLEVALSVGVLRSTVLLPEVSRTWSVGRRRSILLHEFSHVKRWDNLSNLVSQLACALHWFNPLVWSAARQLTVDRERACDDEVLAAGAKASDYAGHLLEIARAVSSRRLWGRMEVSQSSALKDRLHAVLNPRLYRARPSFGGCLLGVALSAAALVPLAALQPWGASADWTAAELDDARAGDRQALVLRRFSPGETASPRARDVVAASASDVLGQESRRRQFESLLELTRPASRPLPRNPASVVRVGQSVSPTAWAPGWSELAGAFRRWTSPTSAPAGPASPVSYRTALFRTPSGRPGDNPTPRPNNPPPPAFEAEVVRLDLGTLGGGESRALDINDLGYVVGESRKPSGLSHPFLWTAKTGMADLGSPLEVHTRAVKVNRAGQTLCETFNSNQFRGMVWSPLEGMVDIGAFDPQDPFTQPRAMNEAGMVAGGSRDASGRLRAFVWTPQGGMLDLGVPGESIAWAINERGQVAGYTEQSFLLGVETRAFFWDPEQGLHFLRPDGAPLSIATALNNRGQVVGYAEFENGLPHAFLWSLETGMIDLGTADPDYPITLATGINDLGHVVGRGIDTVDPTEPRRVRAFRWTSESGMVDIGSAGDESRLAINAVGQIVGAYVLDFDGSEEPGAFLWTEAGLVALKDANSTVVALNNNNQAVGSGLTPEEERHAFLWEIKIRGGDAADAPSR